MASDVFEAALELSADNPYALFGLARIDVANGVLDATQKKLESLAKISNGMIGGYLLVRVDEDRGQPNQMEAIRELRNGSSALNEISDPWLLEQYSNCYDPFRLAAAAGVADHGGDSSKAIRMLKSAIQMAPNEAVLHFQLGSIHLKEGNLSQALGCFSSCVKAKPTFPMGGFSWPLSAPSPAIFKVRQKL